MPADERSIRVAVVTGASSGIGAATAKTLAALGFHVVCAARRADRIAALAAEIGGTAVVTDVTDQASVDALAARVADLGPVHILINNAGGAKGLAPVAEAESGALGVDVADERARHPAGHARAAAHAHRVR